MNAETAKSTAGQAVLTTGDHQAEQNKQICALRGPVRPLFHYGQVLSSADLTAQLDWTQTKHALQRLSLGWGVVSGLTVQAHPSKDGHIQISTGYAIGPCGDDIVVPKNAEYDITGLRAPLPEPDVEPDKVPAGGSDDKSREFAKCKINARSIFAIDVAISYREREADPKLIFNREAGVSPTRIEFNRVEEGYEIAFELVTHDKSERESAAFSESLELIDAFLASFPSTGGKAARIRQWFYDRIAECPIKDLAFVRMHIDALSDDNLTEEPKLCELLFLLILDRRLASFRLKHGPRDRHQDIPLARVWLAVSEQNMPGEEGNERIEVLGIDNSALRRRTIDTADAPSPPGHIDLLRLFGLQRQEVAGALQEMGSALAGAEPFKIPETYEALKASLNWHSTGNKGDGVVVMFRDLGQLGERVVACRTVVPALWIETEPHTLEAHVGDEIRFSTAVWNTANRPIDIEIRSATSGVVLEARARLYPGERAVRTEKLKIPESADIQFDYEAVVADLMPETAMPLATARTTVRVRRPEPALRVTKSVVAPKHAFPGEEIRYRISIRNNSDATVNLRLKDSKLGLDESDIRVKPGAEIEREAIYAKPVEAGARIFNEAHVWGETVDGRTVTGNATHVLSIQEEGPWFWFTGFWQALGRGILKLLKIHHKSRWSQRGHGGG